MSKLFQPIIQVSHAEWKDHHLLHDIDLKCFSDVWPKTYWLYWFDQTTVVFMAKLAKNTVGFAACAMMEDGIVIEKLGVKPDFRRLGVSRSLIGAVFHQAQTRVPPVSIHMAVPEPWLYPGPNCIADWVPKVGFKANTPFLPKYFHIDGEDIDGVRCEYKE